VHDARLEEASRLPQGLAQPLLDLCEVPEDLRVRMVWPAPANRRPDPAVLAELLRLNREVTDRTARAAAKQAVLDASAWAVP
jgi:hypothetical protein